MTEFGYHTLRDADDPGYRKRMERWQEKQNEEEDAIIAAAESLIPALLADGQSIEIMEFVVLIAEKLDLNTGKIHHGIKAAVWSMISNQVLALSSDRKVSLIKS